MIISRFTIPFVFTEEVLPIQTTIIPNGTFIIRKGRERKQVFDLPEFVDQTVEVEFDHEPAGAKESQEVLNIEEANETTQKSMIQPQINVPKYRHSIDLAMHTPMYVKFFMVFIFIEFQLIAFLPRHNEYNSFWSKPEDFQIRHATSLTPSKQVYFIKKDGDTPNKSIPNDDLNIPLMRVASLPIITQPPVSNSCKLFFQIVYRCKHYLIANS